MDVKKIFIEDSGQTSFLPLLDTNEAVLATDLRKELADLMVHYKAIIDQIITVSRTDVSEARELQAEADFIEAKITRLRISLADVADILIEEPANEIAVPKIIRPKNIRQISDEDRLWSKYFSDIGSGRLGETGYKVFFEFLNGRKFKVSVDLDSATVEVSIVN